MADAQFVVYNDAGIEQVSFGGINLAFVQKVTISIGQWTPISGPQQTGLKYSFTVNAASPIVAIASSAAGAAGMVYPVVENIGAGQWRITLFAGSTATSFSSPGATTLTATVYAYVFDEAPAPSGGSAGLALFNAAGKCTFNSNYPGARIMQVLGSYYGSPSSAFGTSLAVPPGRTYAVIMRAQCGQQVTGSRNASTGDELENDYRAGTSGGLSGASVRMGDWCFMDGARSVSKNPFGSVGSVYLSYGNTYNNGTAVVTYCDGIVLDVTGF